MSTRSAAIHTRHTSQRPSGVPVQAAVALNSSSRSSTPTRIHAPRNRGAQNASSEVPPANSTSNNSLPSTPTRKRNTGRKRADARKPRLTDGSDDADTPDEDLMELLGMTSSTPSLPTEKGILSISKAEIDAAEEKTAPPRRTRRQKASEVADLADADTPASSDPEGPRRSRRGKKSTAPADKDQAASASLRNAKGKGAPAAPGDSAGPSMDLSNLSKSLPHSFHSENAKASKNNAAWDMPTEATGGQPLNWQQQLVAAEKDSAPRRSQRQQANGTGGRKNKKQQTPDGHVRHPSHDVTPTSNLTAMLAASGPKSNVPVSAFDSSIPFHTGYNVHRAPQTPIRHGGRQSADITDHSGAISLPIVGEFPRLNKAGGIALGANKYAGPTFHNSPASGSLPAPDLDDF